MDVDVFKAKEPFSDPAFWIAVATSGLLLFFDVLDMDVNTESVAVDLAAMLGWLGIHGYVRGKGVEAAGRAAAEPVQEEDDEPYLVPDVDDYDEMPRPDPGVCPVDPTGAI